MPTSDALDWDFDDRDRRRAEDRADLYEDAIKFAIVVGLLLLFVRPVGVIVGLIWGWKLYKRHLALAPPRRRRHRRRRPRRRPDRERPRSPEQVLVRSFGDDPRSRENLAKAREALAQVETLGDAEAVPAPHAQVSLAGIVDDAVARVAPRAEAVGVRIARDYDGPADMRGDAEQLGDLVEHLLGAILGSFESASTRGGTIEIALGENLARTRVWLRIRDDGPGLDPAALDPEARAFYAPAEDGRFQIDLSKAGGARRRSAGEEAREERA